MMVFNTLATPLGEMTLQANDDGLLGAWFEQQKTMPSELGKQQQDHPVLRLASAQLTDYFNGTRQTFDIPLAAKGTTFQQQVWQALTKIPFGKHCSYADLAKAISNPKAVRAVGAANGRNPISIIVPCHRVIAGNGKLTGYAGGIERKAWLLAHES